MKARASSSIVLFATLFALCPSSSEATDYYIGQISPGGGVVHVSRITDILSLDPGDTVYFGNGSHTDPIVIPVSGTSGNPITFTAWPGELPVIRAPITATSNASWINITNLEVRYVSDASGIRLSRESHHIRIADCTIRNVGHNGIYLAGSYHLVKRCTIYNTGLDTYPYKTHSIYAVANYSRVTENTCYNSNGGNGIRSEGLDLRIDNNHVYNIVHHGISVYADIPTADIIIEDNEVHDCGAVGIAILGPGKAGPPERITIDGNTLYSNGSDLLIQNENHDVVIQNNSIGTIP